MSRVIIIPTDAEPYEADLDLEDNEPIMAVVGGWLEGVTINIDPATYLELGQRDIALIVDEEGLLRQRPLNKVATPFYCPDPRNGVICGTAILVGQHDTGEGWEWTDLPEKVTVEEVKAAGDWAMRMNRVEWR